MDDDDHRHQKQRVASMLQLGSEGLLAIYELTPEEALDRAHETLTSMQVARDAITWLDEMGLVAKIKAADAGARGEKGPDGNTSSTRAFLNGHDKLLVRLQTVVAAGGSFLLGYLSRAGGHELSDEERFEMKRAFDEVEREVGRGKAGAANEPNSE